MKLNKKKKWVAITGGIGAGKSFLSERLREYGCYVFSCDEIVAKFYKDRQFRLKLLYEFPEVYDSKNIIDKEKLTQLVFGDKEKLAKLNESVHPMVFQKINEIAEEQEEDVFFVEAPVLLECGWQKLFDKVVVVTRPLTDRIDAVVKRSGLSRQEVEQRIAGQVDYDNMDLSDYYVIKNDGSEESFKAKIDLLYGDVSSEFGL